MRPAPPLLFVLLLIASSARAQQADDVAPLRQRLAQDYLTGRAISDDLPESALTEVEQGLAALPPKQQAPEKKALQDLRTLREQALGIQKGRDASDEPGIFRREITVLAGKLGVAQEPPLKLYAERARSKPGADQRAPTPRSEAEQRLSAEAVDTLLRDPHVAPALLSELKAKAADYARRLGTLSGPADVGSVSPSGLPNNGPRTLTKAQLAALNKIPSGPSVKLDDRDVPLNGYQRASVEASEYWTLAGADHVNAARDSNNLLTKGYHYGAALADSALAETAALVRGDPTTVRRAAWGATVGVSIVGATAIVAPAALTSAGIVGIGETAAVGDAALTARVGINQAVHFGLRALNTFVGVTSTGEALKDPTLTTVALAAVSVAGEGAGTAMRTSLGTLASSLEMCSAANEAGEGIATIRKFEALGARGIGDADLPTAAGISKFSAENIQFTHGGVEAVERHLARFGPDAPNAAMVRRLRMIADGTIEATEQDRNFYSHELRESVLYRKAGIAPGTNDPNVWRQAHAQALNDYGLPNDENILYHSEADVKGANEALLKSHGLKSEGQ